MFVNGELRFSDENLMDLSIALNLAMDMINEAAEELTPQPQDVEKARELEQKAQAFLGLSETIEEHLMERISNDYPE